MSEAIETTVQTVHGPQALLPRNLACLAKLCSTDDGRWWSATQGVKLDVIPPPTDKAECARYRAIATNGCFLGMVEGASDGEALYPHIPAIAAAPNGASNAIIGRKDWEGAFKSVPKKGQNPVLQRLAVVMGSEVTTLASTNLESATVQSPRNLDGRFPAVDQVIPSGAPSLSIRVDPQYLATLLTVALAFTDEENHAVQLDFYGDSKPFKVTAKRSEDAQTFTGLLVPLCPGK